MNKLILLSISILVLNLVSCRHDAEAPRGARSEFASRIARVLPQGWALQENGAEVIINRQEPVTLFTCVSLDVAMLRDKDRFEQFVKRNGAPIPYRIRLRRSEKLEASEYDNRSATNDQIRVTKSTLITNREFFEDDAMRSFDPRYRELPEYYDETSSIYLETTAHPYECAYPRSVAEECDTVRQNLDSLFNRYAKDKPRKTLSYGIW